MRQYINQQVYPGEFLLHQKYGGQSELLLDLIWTHCNIVADITTTLIDQAKFNTDQTPREYAIQASLLCDVGVYQCAGYEHFPGQPPQQRPYIQHGLIGAYILEQEGYSKEVIQVAHAHTGVGLTAADIRNYGLDLPEADYLPLTPLQQLITYASKFHSKAPRFKTVAEIENSLARYGQEKITKFQQFHDLFGEPDLTEIKEKYDQWHRSISYQIEQLSSIKAQEAQAGPNLNSAGIAV